MSIVVAACGSGTRPNPTAPTPAPTVVSITVTSGVTTGVTFQLGAAARLSDGSTLDVTGNAVWDSSNLSVATVAQGGAVVIQASGTVDLRATYGNMSGSTHVIVTRVAVVSLAVTGAVIPATSFQLTATARLSDGSTQNVTGLATWHSSDSATATVSSSGFVRVLATGPIEIRAVYQDMTGSSRLIVSRPPAFPLSGIVLAAGPDGRPIAGAQVRVLESDLSGNPAFTDANGAFTVPGLEVGRHLVEVTRSHYQTWGTDIMIVDRALQITAVLDLATDVLRHD